MKKIICVVLSALYVISPIDIIPDMLPIVGWIDDILIALGGVYALLKK